MRHLLACLLALLACGPLLAACGDDDVVSRDGGRIDLGSSSGDTGAPDAPAPPPPPGDMGAPDAPTPPPPPPPPPPPADGGPIACGIGVSSFPEFGRACTVDSDCFVARHQVDCCGTRVALGLATSERAAFEEAERICAAMYPGCGCPSGPTRTDDGTSILGGPDAISVACRAGSCHTSVVVSCDVASATFPELDRTCTVDSDCALAMHEVDCCGTLRAIGMAASQQAVFDAAEAACRSMRPDCDCASMPTTTDDGSPVAGGPESILVECRGAQCFSAPRGV